MKEARPTNGKRSSAVPLPHDWRIRAKVRRREEIQLSPKGIAYGLGKDASIFYFMAPLQVDRCSPAIQYSLVEGADEMKQFAVPAFIVPREDLQLEKGYFLIETSMSPALMKESSARFIKSIHRALDLMQSVQEAIIEKTGTSDLSRLKPNLEAACNNPDMADQWIKAARSLKGNGFPTNAFDFWKRIYALIFWHRICEIRTPDLPHKRGGGWDADRAAILLNQYYRNRSSALGELERFAKWKPYTARWLREFEVNEGLSSKAPDGRKL